jgi:pyruvate/2-oxoglutarate dehydrogenase complex dihydrolipoamide dehydrogenase (E3) component
MPRLATTESSESHGRPDSHWFDREQTTGCVQEREGGRVDESVRGWDRESCSDVTTTDFDVIVVGSGSGGRAVAGRLADAGLRIAMVESGRVGGECPYWACMPAKAILRAPEAVAAARRVPGVTAKIESVEEVIAFREQVVSGRDDETKVDRYTARGVSIVRGHGRLDGPGRVTVGGRTLRAQRIVIATGSTPVIPKIEGLDGVDYWTNREAMETLRIPDSVAVLGGGPVGVEIGQAFARLGAHVTIVEAGPRLLDNEAPEIGELLGRCFRAEGIDVMLGAKATRARRGGLGTDIALDGGADLTAERLIVATGRRPRVDDIGLESVGIVPGKQGIYIDDRCRATDGIWALGDVTGVGQFTHVASYQGRIVCGDILGEAVKADYSAIPRSVFCDPEVAAVGMTAVAAGEAGIDTAVASVPVDGLERARTYGCGIEGIIGVVADRQAGVLVGAHGVGPMASEWMGMAVLAIRAQVPIAVLREVIAQFPTFSEGLITAVRELDM